jgi:hypothetical protein
MLVAIVPGEGDGVFSSSLHPRWPDRFAKHGDRAGHCGWWNACLSTRLRALIVTQRARASVAQKLEGVVALVAIFPHDVHTGATGFIYLNCLRIGLARHQSSIARENGATLA